MIPKKILVVFTHPRKDSLNHALKDSVLKGLHLSGAETREQNLYEEGFNPLLYDNEENSKDKVIVAMQANISWADGIIFVTPLWWANVPAMLKGYFDRVFTEGFAFKYNQAGFPEGLLEGKKAIILGTGDTPPVIARVAGTVLGFKSVIKGILKFCGIKKSSFILLGSVLKSTAKKRQKWLVRAEKIGRTFAAPEGKVTKFKQTSSSFIKAVRLPLFSFVFSLIFLGSALGASIKNQFSWGGFFVSLFIGLMGHAAVSLSNEASDEATDRINTNRTMFNGGTGLMMKAQITKPQLNMGWVVTAILAVTTPLILVVILGYHWLLIASTAIALFLGIEYSLPPFRFSRLGLGEIAAFFAYGIPMVLIGLILQTNHDTVTGIMTGYRFFLLALPVSLAVLVTLCLTQIPDTEADKSIGKKSVSVLLGPRKVMILSIGLLGLCILLFTSFIILDILPLHYSLSAMCLPLLTIIVILFNLEAYKIPAGMVMINIMGLSVTSAVFSGVIPAIYFLNNSVGINLTK
jgi:putative NADPH-quinone reductase/1,4-dihydroxy-2-naphthoate octaprenyltransferase